MPRKRTANWSPQELHALISAVKKQEKAVSKQGASGNSMEERRQAWKYITTAVNAVGVHPRTIQQIKEKWQNFSYARRRRFPTLSVPRLATADSVNEELITDTRTASSSDHSTSDAAPAIAIDTPDQQIVTPAFVEMPKSETVYGPSTGPTIESVTSLAEVALPQERLPVHNDRIVTATGCQSESNDLGLTEHQRRMEIMEAEHAARMDLLAREAKLVDAKLELVRIKAQVAQEKLKVAKGQCDSVSDQDDSSDYSLVSATRN